MLYLQSFLKKTRMLSLSYKINLNNILNKSGEIKDYLPNIWHKLNSFLILQIFLPILKIKYTHNHNISKCNNSIPFMETIKILPKLTILKLVSKEITFLCQLNNTNNSHNNNNHNNSNNCNNNNSRINIYNIVRDNNLDNIIYFDYSFG